MDRYWRISDESVSVMQNCTSVRSSEPVIFFSSPLDQASSALGSAVDCAPPNAAAPWGAARGARGAGAGAGARAAGAR